MRLPSNTLEDIGGGECKSSNILSLPSFSQYFVKKAFSSYFSLDSLNVIDFFIDMFFSPGQMCEVF